MSGLGVEKIVNLGLVGVGAWGRNYLTTVSKLSGVKISSVLRKTDSPLKISPSIPVAKNFDELLSSCDGVIVASPPDSHSEYVIRALDSGRPVLVEKPIALNIESAHRMFECSINSGVPLLVGHIHLFSPAFQVLRAWTSDWELKSIESLAGNWGPFRSYSPLLDWGPHDVSMCLSLFSEPPEDVFAERVESGAGYLYELTLTFGDSTATLKFGNGLEKKVRNFSVSSGKDKAVYDGTFTFRGKPVPIAPTTPLEEMVLSFVSCVAEGKTDWRYEPSLALRTASVLDKAATLISTRRA